MRREDALAALATVNDPELHRDLVSLGMVKEVEVQASSVRAHIELTTPACPLKDTIRADVEAALRGAGATEVQVDFSARVRPGVSGMPGVKHVLLVGSGKGGVGKSAVAVNVAVALAQSGARVGLLDADVYGPSVGQMMGLPQDKIKANPERQMLPLEAHGVRFISMANLSPAGQALVWRGPMLHSAVSQFLKDTAWGELDYLIVDLPPGTGDVQLSLTQTVQVSGALLVSTPQKVALIDAARAADMFRKAGVPILGVIENMSHFVAPDTGRAHDLFGRGGAAALGFPVLAEVPIETALREGADAGVPQVLAHPDSPSARALTAAARALAGALSVQSFAEELPMA